ncbi:MAG: Ig-like domain repeat protein [Candidatus Sulfotelmatobacter sp.]
MASAGSFIFRFFSSRVRAGATGLLALLVALIVWSPWRGHAQSPTKAPAFRKGGGHLAMAPYKVPFKPGPVGADGKVHQLAPKKTPWFIPEGETEQAEAARERADAGIFDLTTKPRTRALSPDELKSLNWFPTKVNVPALGAQKMGAVGNNPLNTSKEVNSAHNSSSSRSTPGGQTGFPGIGYTGDIPPDGGVAAGHVNVVSVVNDTINVWDKNGNLLSSEFLSDLFSAVGTPAQDFLFDPSVEYDWDFQRFFVLATSENDSANRSNWLLAVSVADDVTQGWNVFALDATLNGNSGTSNWCDYPHLGLDSVAIYMSCNMFSFPATSGSFQYDKIRIMTKDELVNGPCCSWWDFWDIREGFLNLSTSFSVRPAVMHFSRDTDGDFWINAAGNGGSDDTLHIWQLTNAADCCNGSTSGPNLDGEHDDGVGSFGTAPKGAQPNGATGIDTGDTRVLYATWYFNHLSIGQTIACNQGGTTDACAAFTEIDTSNYPNFTNVNDWVLGEPAGVDVYYPYVEQNANADKTMVYTRSDGSVTYPGAYSAPIPNVNVCTTCIGSETTLQAGQGNYAQIDEHNRNRWGDYHGAGADPDFLGIWVEGEYADNFNDWETQIIATYNTYVPIDSPSPSPLAFGNQAIFSASGSRGVVITNNGNATLRIGSVTISAGSDFFITSDGCSFQFIQSGNSCSVFVSFSPTVIGSDGANLKVPDNTPSGVALVPLTGTGVQAGTSTSVTSSLDPSTFTQSVTFTAQVLSSTTRKPTGNVTFKNGATVMGTKTLSGGVAKLTTSALSGGTHSITATYNGNTDFLSSISPGLSQVVHPASTTATLTSSRSTSTFGQGITFTSKVTSGVGTPTGSVTIKNGTATLGTVPLASGTATFTTSTLSAGSHSITAVYDGATDFATSTSKAVKETVNKATTKTALASSLNPSSFGQSVTFNATVSPQFGGTVTGTVVFKDGATALGSRTLSGGKASLTLSSLHAGNHAITASYDGNTDLLSSTSAVVTQVVHKANTKTALTSSPNPSTSGQGVTFTATITPSFTGTPTGTVTFRDNTKATVLGTGAVNSSRKASFTTSKLAVGTHSVSASYGGDTNFNTSTSSAVSQVVK